MIRIFTMSQRDLLTLVLKLHDLFESCTILMRAGNQKRTIINRVRTIEQIYVLDPVKKEQP